jgi:hypothetical protein
LAARNGTSLAVGPNGQALSKATGASLKFLGFEDSRQGMGEAIRAGAVYVLVGREAEVIRVGGEEGFSIWKAADSIIGGQVCLRCRKISGKGGCLLTTVRGAAAARNIGVPYKILECAAPLPLGDRRGFANNCL